MKQPLYIRSLLLSLIIVILAALPLQALTIKLGTLTPRNTPWEDTLKELAAEWKRISGGQIQLKIYSGTVGDEPDMVRKMKIGQLQAVVITASGMAYISPEVLAINLPFLVKNDAELAYLLKKTTPYFEKKMLQKGFRVIAWTNAGWVKIFSTKPVRTPDDLMKLKLAVSKEDQKQIDSWKEIGHKAIPIAMDEIMTGIQSGMVEAIYSLPMFVAVQQWFGILKYMCDIKMAPVIGGIIIVESTWEKIPENIKPELVRATERVIAKFNRTSTILDRKSVEIMQQHGLKVIKITPAQQRLWQQHAEKGYKIFIGRTFPRELFFRIKEVLREYRSR